MRYYISDLHFFHENLNHSLDCRGFDSACEMNEYIIEKWNKKVREGDEVVLLGDFSAGHAEETNEVLRRLHGRLFLIEGNHDHVIRHRKFDASRFGWIKPYAEMHDNKRKVILSHYPIFCYNGQCTASTTRAGQRVICSMDMCMIRTTKSSSMNLYIARGSHL